MVQLYVRFFADQFAYLIFFFFRERKYVRHLLRKLRFQPAPGCQVLRPLRRGHPPGAGQTGSPPSRTVALRRWASARASHPIDARQRPGPPRLCPAAQLRAAGRLRAAPATGSRDTGSRSAHRIPMVNSRITGSRLAHRHLMASSRFTAPRRPRSSFPIPISARAAQDRPPWSWRWSAGWCFSAWQSPWAEATWLIPRSCPPSHRPPPPPLPPR